jgi:hypothetical protein
VVESIKIDTQVIKADQVEEVEELSSDALVEDEEATGQTLAPVADEIELDVDEIDFDVALPEPLAAVSVDSLPEGRRTSPFLDYRDEDDLELDDAIASVSAELEAADSDAGFSPSFREPDSFMQLGAVAPGPPQGDDMGRLWADLSKELK